MKKGKHDKLKRHYTKREIKLILKNNGWQPIRQSGGHIIYKNEEGKHLSIGICNYNAMIFQRLMKENGMTM